MQTTNYYPYGGVFCDGNSKDYDVQPYKYNGKELDHVHGLNAYDYGARMLDAALPVWDRMDPLCEKYYGVSPYVYCAGNPVNAIDFEGELTIFINGFQPKWFFESPQKYWNGFDNKILMHFQEKSEPKYYDGALGSYSSLFNGKDCNILESNREILGYAVGTKDASDIIASLKRDKHGNIIEKIRIVTHSMGGAFGKGFVQALIDYVKSHSKLCEGLNIAEYDFAPFQSGLQSAVPGVDTYQYSHSGDWLAGNDKIKRAHYMNTYSDNQHGHSIDDFRSYVNSLPQGKYVYRNGKFIKVN